HTTSNSLCSAIVPRPQRALLPPRAPDRDDSMGWRLKLRRTRPGTVQTKREEGTAKVPLESMRSRCPCARRRRSDCTHQHSRRSIDAYAGIAVEELAVKQLVHSHCLATSMHDAAWSQCIACIADRAAGAGRPYVGVH